MLSALRKHGGIIGEWATDAKPNNNKVKQHLKPFQVNMQEAINVCKMVE